MSHAPSSDRRRSVRAWLPQKLAYAIVRGERATGIAIFNLSRRARNDEVMLRKARSSNCPRATPSTLIRPSYNPWTSGCAWFPTRSVTAIARARVDRHRHIDTFTESGIRLQSGAELEATSSSAPPSEPARHRRNAARVDGRAWNCQDGVVQGMMLSGVPNFAWTIAIRTRRGR